MRRRFLQTKVDHSILQGRSQGGPGGPPPSQSKCCFRFLGWISAEICLKCIILVTNFQNSPSAGGSPLPAPLNLHYWWPEVMWFEQIVVFKLIETKSNFKKSVMTSFPLRQPDDVTKQRHNFFPFCPLPPNQQHFNVEIFLAFYIDKILHSILSIP